MLFLKRLLSVAINLLLFIAVSLIMVSVLSFFNIYYPKKLIIIVSYSLTIIAPIVIINRTLGYKIAKIDFKITDNIDRINILFKYTIYLFLIITRDITSFMMFIVTFLEQYTYIVINPFIINGFTILVIILLFITFAFSRGKHSILDYILNIKINNYYYHYNRNYLNLYAIYIIWIFLILGYVIHIIELKDVKQYIGDKNKIIASNYFPNDIFADFTNNIETDISYSDSVILLSKPQSLFHNTRLLRFNLNANVNHETFMNEKWRFELCRYLIYYSRYCLLDRDLDIAQIKLNLIYNDVHPIYEIENKYTYFLDLKEPVFGLYGEINEDTLKLLKIEYYKTTLKNYLEYVASETRINVDTLEKYFDGKDFRLPDSYNLNMNKYTEEYEISVNINKIIKRHSLLIPFNEVKPHGYFRTNLMFPFN